MKNYIVSPHSIVRFGWDKASRPANEAEIKHMMGITPNKKWPNQGMPTKNIQGIVVYVTELGNPSGNFHRARAICPVCTRDVSAGRLAQHAKIHKAT